MLESAVSSFRSRPPYRVLRFADDEMRRCPIRSVFSDKGWAGVDFDNLSNEELCLLLKERIPAVFETVGKVTDSNRETVVAFLKFISANAV